MGINLTPDEMKERLRQCFTNPDCDNCEYSDLADCRYHIVDDALWLIGEGETVRFLIEISEEIRKEVKP